MLGKSSVKLTQVLPQTERCETTVELVDSLLQCFAGCDRLVHCCSQLID